MPPTAQSLFLSSSSSSSSYPLLKFYLGRDERHFCERASAGSSLSEMVTITVAFTIPPTRFVHGC